MNGSLERQLAELLDGPIKIRDSRPLSGGCISEVLAVTLDAGSSSNLPSQIVVKRNAAQMEENFRCETEGLQAIAKTEAIRVPKPLATGVIDGQALLVLEWIESGASHSRDECFERFGYTLANFHRQTQGEQIGWPTDNFLGAAAQPNRECDTWIEFVAEHRLGFQLRWASDQGLADTALRRDVERIIASLERCLAGRDQTISLLHGDLWSGNYLFDTAGDPVLLDPAVYRGCREAEWGMILLFGGCPPIFGRAYQEEWPMPEGWHARARVYLLYHELNHLNLFGTSYLGGCKSTAREILAAL